MDGLSACLCNDPCSAVRMPSSSDGKHDAHCIRCDSIRCNKSCWLQLQHMLNLHYKRSICKHERKKG